MIFFFRFVFVYETKIIKTRNLNTLPRVEEKLWQKIDEKLHVVCVVVGVLGERFTRSGRDFYLLWVIWIFLGGLFFVTFIPSWFLRIMVSKLLFRHGKKKAVLFARKVVLTFHKQGIWWLVIQTEIEFHFYVCLQCWVQLSFSRCDEKR
jgi:hypothetical protein